MNKYFFSIVTSLLIGLVMAFLLINSYDNKSMMAFKNVGTVYYIERGVYSSKENMEENMMDFENYIYNVEKGQYHTYIGITGNKDNVKKLQNYYKDYKTQVREKITDNKNFLTALRQYDEILLKTKDEGTIKTICNQVLSKYEELINNEY